MANECYILLAERVLLLEGEVLAMVSEQETRGSGHGLAKPFGRRTGGRAKRPPVLLLRVSEADRYLATVLEHILASTPHVAPVVFGADGHPPSNVEFSNRPSQYRHAMRAPPALTRRQMQVLQAMAEGVTEREIARRLGISERTVQLHVASTSRALGVCSHFQLGLTAARLGLLQPSSRHMP